jgi:hypothetical protein
MKPTMFRPFVISSLLMCLAMCLVVCLALSASARTRSRYGGVLRIETRSDPWRVPDGIARKLVFDGLTRLDDSGVVLPELAIRWESQNDNHRWQSRYRNPAESNVRGPDCLQLAILSFS